VGVRTPAQTIIRFDDASKSTVQLRASRTSWLDSCSTALRSPTFIQPDTSLASSEDGACQAFNRRIFLTGDRLLAAANFRREIKDIKLKLRASLQKREDGLDLAVDVRSGWPGGYRSLLTSIACPSML